MRTKLGIISYDAPHQKTALFMETWRKSETFEIELFCLPFRPRPSRHVLFQHRPVQSVGPKIPCLAADFGFPVQCISKMEDLPTTVDLYILLGAPLITSEVAESRFILNCHSGLLPYVRGLDAFKWAILLNQPLGATLHRIDGRVDLGYAYANRRTEISFDTTLEEAAVRHYRNEILLLTEFEVHLNSTPRRLQALPDFPPRRRMPEAQEKEMLVQWPAYRERWAS